MLKIFFTGLDNFILLRCMGWDDGWEDWRSIFCFFLTIKLFRLYFSPSTYSLWVYSVQCKDPGDLDLFGQTELDSLTHFSSDPLVQWVTSWKKHELLLVIIIPSPFLECLWRHQASTISVIKSSFVCSFCDYIQLVHGRERVFLPKMMVFLS